ncbi:carnitine O-acetyltransferase-like [Oncorhynchus mykiss]|uniref:carnitine O-acetyltransferase-like n=1 Tax=Oncorhynchus mykiss TaxID=8022 RepID=UPI0018784186|nr:carnitine O-acetyltransferase-like [Oncorhynchus mykiss]
MAAQILHGGGTHLNSGNHWFDKTLQMPKKLYFNIGCEIKRDIEHAKQNLDILINDLDIHCFNFQRFGKELPKRHNLSPNSFIQVALQLGYYKVHNEVCASCDIASQRMFRGGRTDDIRSPTNQMLKFVLAFDDPTISVRIILRA